MMPYSKKNLNNLHYLHTQARSYAVKVLVKVYFNKPEGQNSTGFACG